MRAFLIVLFTFFSLHAVQAEERILDFASDLMIKPNGRVLVSETITVKAEGDQIRRGIYRDFFIRFEGRHGETIQVGFDVLSVTKNGGNEPFFTERDGNILRLYIGREDVHLPAGQYTYTITYETDRQVRHFENRDEIYWNVTGNGWVFPIDNVEATVHLPPGATVQDTTYFTGSYGAKGKDARVDYEADGGVHFTALRKLKRREGLTIAVAFDKGYVTPPTAAETFIHVLQDNLHLLIGVLGVIALTGYFGYIWHKVGRDPEAGPEVPRYEPPRHMSPAAMAFVRSMGFKLDGFTAAIVSLAVKGALTIEDDTSGYRLIKNKGARPFGLFKGERALLGTLFREGDIVHLKQKNHKLLKSSQGVLERALKQEFENHYFKTNARYWVVGFAMTITVLIAMVVAASHFQQNLTIFNGLIAVVMLGMLPIFYYLLKAPTKTGRETMDYIDGFRLFLGVTEKDRLNFHNPPERTPEMFEKYLPHAIALGVENAWGEQFESILKNASQDGSDGYHPRWYHGRSRFSPVGFAGGLGSGLNSAVASASTAPRSSSSSGFSGGFSGGGGGGAGGGGW